MTYQTIVADPPWDYAERFRRGASGFGHGASGFSKSGTRPPYPTMRLAAIEALPVEAMAARDSHLWLWTTNAFMEEAHRVARGWGFRPISILTWRKVNGDGTVSKGGMGYYLRSATEHVIFAVRGSLPPCERNAITVFDAPRLPHSTKPDEFYRIVERLSPAPRVDVFARRTRLGWDAIGDELGKPFIPAPPDDTKADRAGSPQGGQDAARTPLDGGRQ